MVSGLVTSPWDQERIFSGLAKLIRIESKSAIRLARSYGLLRYKVAFLPAADHAAALPVSPEVETVVIQEAAANRPPLPLAASAASSVRHRGTAIAIREPGR